MFFQTVSILSSFEFIESTLNRNSNSVGSDRNEAGARDVETKKNKNFKNAFGGYTAHFKTDSQVERPTDMRTYKKINDETDKTIMHFFKQTCIYSDSQTDRQA